MISEYYSRIMAAKQIQCPNCGASIQASQLAEVECPYCGSKFENPLNKKSEGSVIKKIIPFSLSANDVREILFKEFVYKDDVAKDIFDKLQIHNLKQYYLPMYLFYGKYRADWSCTVIYEQKDKQGNKIEEYRPASGTATGNFSKLTLACGAGRNLPQGLKRYANVLEWTSKLDSKITKFEASYLVGENRDAIEVIESNITEKEAWNKSALQSSIEKDAKDAAHSQTPNRVIENYHVTANWEGSRGELVLVPVWYGSYAYDGEEHFFAIDGRGTNFDYSYPHDSTDEVRGWKVVGRFFLMVALLFGIGYLANIKGLKVIVALAGIIFLTCRFVYEYGKSSEELSAIKLIGKAKMCGEKIPAVSSNYKSFKRTNRIMMWAFIGLFAIWCFGSVEIEKRNKEQQAMKIEMATQSIASSLAECIFYSDRDKIGHLRQDLREKIVQLGFVKTEYRKTFGKGEKYIYEINGQCLFEIYINDENSYSGSIGNEDDDIKYVAVKILNKNEEYNVFSNMAVWLERHGFCSSEDKEVYTEYGIPYKSAVRVGKEIHKKEGEYFPIDKYFADWDVAVMTYSDYSVIEPQIKCYSRNGTKSVLDTDEITSETDTAAVEASDYAAAEVIDEVAYEVEEASEEPAR